MKTKRYNQTSVSKCLNLSQETSKKKKCVRDFDFKRLILVSYVFSHILSIILTEELLLDLDCLSERDSK